MKASVVDLRYKMKDVLKALARNEPVTVMHRGKVQGTIVPKHNAKAVRVQEHPFFGSSKTDRRSVAALINELRAPRYR